MLLWETHHLTHYFHAFRVFQYLTLRSIMSSLTALLIVLSYSPTFIARLIKLQIGQSIRHEGPQSHLKKQGTPTMGGALVIFSIVLSVLLWADLSNHFIWTLLTVMILFGWIGWSDDYRKVVQGNSKGLSARWKFFWQSSIGTVAAIFLYMTSSIPAETQLILPFFKQTTLNLGLSYIILSYFVIVGSSNAINLTDGLDGLVLMPTVMISGALGIFAYLTGNHFFASYLAIPYIPRVGEIVIFCSSFVGASLGFLWYNTYPAQVFMGDVGSLGLGAALGMIAIIVRQELVFFLMSGIFVAETISVILQVASFKLIGKRMFRMTPLHHHFELKGWPEPRIIVRFWIITLVLVLCGLATLKLR